MRTQLPGAYTIDYDKYFDAYMSQPDAIRELPTEKELMELAHKAITREQLVLLPLPQGEPAIRGDTATIKVASNMPRYNKEKVTVTLGRGLYNKELEEELISHRVGDAISVSIQGEPVTAGILELKRKQVPEPTDEMVMALQAKTDDGKPISTVKEYEDFKGVQVIYQPINDKTAFTVGSIESFQETARRNKLCPITRVVRFQTLSADEALARESGFPLGSRLLMIHRVREIDGKSLILDINYFLEELMPGLTPEIAQDSIYAYLEKQLGMQIVTSKRRITVERANAFDRKCLDLDGYNCLAVVTSNTFNSDGIMFEYTQSRHHPEYFSFQDTATRKRW